MLRDIFYVDFRIFWVLWVLTEEYMPEIQLWRLVKPLVRCHSVMRWSFLICVSTGSMIELLTEQLSNQVKWTPWSLLDSLELPEGDYQTSDPLQSIYYRGLWLEPWVLNKTGATDSRSCNCHRHLRNQISQPYWRWRSLEPNLELLRESWAHWRQSSDPALTSQVPELVSLLQGDL